MTVRADPDAYAATWRELTWRRLVPLAAAGFLVALAVGAALGAAAFGVAALLAGAGVVGALTHLRRLRCPRCGDYFAWTPHAPNAAPFPRACFHCGLPRGAAPESDAPAV